MFGGLNFLKKFTPKPDTTQSIDAGLKLVAELLAFCFLHGMPKASLEGVANFVLALNDYGKSDLMRIAAWIIVDGLLPLGPDFMQKIVVAMSDLASGALSNHSAFQKIADYIPGDDIQAKQNFIIKALDAASDWIGNFVEEKGLTPEVVEEKLLRSIQIADGGMDYVAAALDASTSYFSHTGVQTVARVLVQKSYRLVREEVWEEYRLQG